MNTGTKKQIQSKNISVDVFVFFENPAWVKPDNRRDHFTPKFYCTSERHVPKNIVCAGDEIKLKRSDKRIKYRRNANELVFFADEIKQAEFVARLSAESSVK